MGRISRFAIAAGAVLLTVPQIGFAANSECVRVVGPEWAARHTIDPARVNAPGDAMYSWALYEPLAWVDNSFQLTPHLAESWESNEAGTVWTYHLRKGVKFHDGSDFDADDVVYTYRRLIDPEAASPAAAEFSYLSPEMILAVDKHTVRFSLDAPRVELPLLLSSKFALMVPSGATNEQMATVANGTGPFMLDAFKSDAPRATLRANPNYWRAGLPKAKCIELSGIIEPVSRTAAISSGQVDIVLVADPAMLLTLKDDPNVEIIQEPGSEFFVMTMWVDTPPFDDVRVRQALKLVIDREAMVQTALLGYGTPANDNPIIPNSPDAYRSDMIPQDIAKAKQLLAEAGYADGLTVDLNTGAADFLPGNLVMVQAYKEMAAKAGIDVNIVTSPNDSYWDDIWLQRPFVVSYWSPRPPGAAFAIGYRTDAKYNETHWFRSDFDALLDRAGSTVDAGERRKLYQDAQRILAEEGGVIVPMFTSRIAAIRKGCSGHHVHIDINRLQYADMSCDN